MDKLDDKTVDDIFNRIQIGTTFRNSYYNLTEVTNMSDDRIIIYLESETGTKYNVSQREFKLRIKNEHYRDFQDLIEYKDSYIWYKLQEGTKFTNKYGDIITVIHLYNNTCSLKGFGTDRSWTICKVDFEREHFNNNFTNFTNLKNETNRTIISKQANKEGIGYSTPSRSRQTSATKGFVGNPIKGKTTRSTVVSCKISTSVMCF